MALKRYPRRMAVLSLVAVAAGLAFDVVEERSLLRWAGIAVVVVGIVALAALIPALVLGAAAATPDEHDTRTTRAPRGL